MWCAVWGMVQVSVCLIDARLLIRWVSRCGAFCLPGLWAVCARTGSSTSCSAIQYGTVRCDKGKEENGDEKNDVAYGMGRNKIQVRYHMMHIQLGLLWHRVQYNGDELCIFVVSHDIKSSHIKSHDIDSHHITSYNIAWHLITSHQHTSRVFRKMWHKWNITERPDIQSVGVVDPVPAFRTLHSRDVFRINAEEKILYGQQVPLLGILFPCCKVKRRGQHKL